jgi:hypothetical protein
MQLPECALTCLSPVTALQQPDSLRDNSNAHAGFAGPPARVTVAGLPAATTTRMFQLLPAERFHHWLRWEIESLLERFKFRLVANRIQKWINL